MLNLSSLEVALAVERPVDLHPEGFLSQNDGMPGDPPGPEDSALTTTRCCRSCGVPENQEHR
jgi:hypothetical protein